MRSKRFLWSRMLQATLTLSCAVQPGTLSSSLARQGPLGPVSGGSWQPVGPGILGQTPMAPPPGMPGVPGAAAAHGAGFRGFSAPRYGVAPTVMPKITAGG